MHSKTEGRRVSAQRGWISLLDFRIPTTLIHRPYIASFSHTSEVVPASFFNSVYRSQTTIDLGASVVHLLYPQHTKRAGRFDLNWCFESDTQGYIILFPADIDSI